MGTRLLWGVPACKAKLSWEDRKACSVVMLDEDLHNTKGSASPCHLGDDVLLGLSADGIVGSHAINPKMSAPHRQPGPQLYHRQYPSSLTRYGISHVEALQTLHSDYERLASRTSLSLSSSRSCWIIAVC
jgi:hypothetical protein